MQTILVTVSVFFVLYLSSLPGCQYRSLQRATLAADQGRFDSAWQWLLPSLEESPAFFPARAKMLCGQISVHQAEALATAPVPDFSQATQLLLNQAKRCQGFEHPDTKLALEKIASLHLTSGTALCQRGDHFGAVRVFQAMAALDGYPERFVREAAHESAWCRLTHSRKLIEQEMFREAADELTRLKNIDDSSVRKAALDYVPYLAEKEISFWLEREQIIRAVDAFDRQQNTFGQEPELALSFPRLESWLEMHIFGEVLSQPCIGKQKDRKDRKTAPVTEFAGQVEWATDSTLLLQNRIGATLRVLLRGPRQEALQVDDKKSQSILLEPGDYVVGLFSPGQCRIRPRRAVWKITPHEYRTVEVVMEGKR